MADNFLWTGASSSVWSTGGNWTPSGPPAAANSDTALFDQNAVAAVAGSDQSGIQLAKLTIASTFASYAFGDLATPLKVLATLVRIGDASGSSVVGAHSGRINLDLHTALSTVIVVGTKTSSTDPNKEPVRIKAVNVNNKLLVYGTSRVGVATNALADVATFGEIACLDNGSIVNVGAGVTLTTFRQEAGTGNLYGSMTNLKQDGGVVNTFGSGTIAAAFIAGLANLSSTGAITAMTIEDGGDVDLTAPCTVTTLTLYKGASVAYDPSIVTITNPIVLAGCELDDVTINTPKGLTVAIVKT